MNRKKIYNILIKMNNFFNDDDDESLNLSFFNDFQTNLDTEDLKRKIINTNELII